MLTTTKETRPGPGDASRYGLGRDRRAGHAVAALRAGVLGQDMDMDFELGRDELELAGEVLADAMLRAAAAGAGLLGLGQVVLDADVREVIERGSPRRARRLGRGSGGAASGSVGAAGVGLDRRVEEVEEMPLVRVVDEAFAARAEDIAAEQGQRLGQLGVLLLQLAVVGGGLRRARAGARRCGAGRPRPAAERPRPAAATRRCGGAGRGAAAGTRSGSSGRRGVTLIP